MNKRRLFPALALYSLTLLAYSNSFHAGFVWDNKFLILEDPRIRAATPENLSLIFQHTYWWPTGEAGLYRPLTTLSYLFNYAVLEDVEQPAGYHWTNLILHSINALLVYVFALKLTGRLWPSLFLGALWAVHPASTESVTNIVGRSDLLAAMSVLAGFLIYLKSAAAVGWRKLAWLAGLAIVTTLGVFSKESAVMIVGVIVLYELAWWRDVPSLAAGLLATLPPIAAMLVARFAVLRAAPISEFPFTDNPITGAGFWIARTTAIQVMARYVWLTVWPARLSIDYSYSEIPLAHGMLRICLVSIAAGAAVAFAILLYRRDRTTFFFAGFAFLTFLPTSNLIFPIGTIMADRFLYLPSVGILACLVLAIYRLPPPKLAPALLCLIIAAFASRTWLRNLDWKSDLTLATAATHASPNSYKVHKVLASLLFNSDSSNLGRVAEETRKTLSILDPLPDALNDSDAYRWAGGFFLAQGDAGRAKNILVRCIAICTAHDQKHPGAHAASEPEAYRLLSAAYLRLNEVKDAEQAVKRSRALDPMNPEAYHQTAAVLLRQDNPDATAIALTAGIFLTGNAALREDLIHLYQSGLDHQGCALISETAGPVFNPACALVHRHICASSADVIRALLARGRRDQAQTQESMFLHNFGCPNNTYVH